MNSELTNHLLEDSGANADLQNLASSLGVGALFLDNELRIRFFTNPAQQYINLSNSDIGRPLQHITHHLHYAEMVGDAQKVLSDLNAIEREVSDARNNRYLARCAPYRASSGHMSGVIFTFLDISARHRAEMALQSARHEALRLARITEVMLSSIQDIVCTFDRERRFYSVNQALCDVLGLPKEDIVGKGFLELGYPPDLATRLNQEIDHVYATKSTLKNETSFVDHEGKQGYYEYILTPILDDEGNVEFVADVTRDISSHRAMNEALQEADRRKDEFLATLAHELRNPLSPITNGLELLRKSNYDAATVQQTVPVIERQVRYISHLVNDLLEVSRISHNKIELHKEHMSLQSAIAMARETAIGIIESKRHSFSVSVPDAPVPLFADPARVAQILLNLLINSAKYTREGGRIWLNARTEGDEVVITVGDNGAGIDAAMADRIFEMFGQVDKGHSDTALGNGLGIGLTVVKQLVELHGGSLALFSAGKGCGSEFTVRLPLDPERDIAVEPADTISQNATAKSTFTIQKRVLVVDDNADLAMMLNLLLTGEGHAVRTACDGKNALKTARDFQPQVCICDIGMPEMTGHELAGHLTRILPDTMLIALSGWGRDGDRRRSFEAGFHHHLVKGTNFDELIALVGGSPLA